MSKYVLAKDLPFAMSGTEVYLQDKVNDDPYVWIKNPYENGIGNKLGLASVLLKQGWIKEVLPREWNLLIVNGEPYDYSYSPLISIDKQERVKVREVLE